MKAKDYIAEFSAGCAQLARQLAQDTTEFNTGTAVIGHWEKTSETMPIYRCSICKQRNLFKNGDNVLSNYCPHCGADMRGNTCEIAEIVENCDDCGFCDIATVCRKVGEDEKS